MLQPIIQAAQLLQARKTDKDVTSICDMCNKMTTNQVNIFFTVVIVRRYEENFDFEPDTVSR